MFINFSNPVVRQYAVVIAANLSVISCGMSIVWVSPMLIKLRDPNQTILPRPITPQEEAWIVGIGSLFTLVAFPINGYAIERIGRKWTLLLSFLSRFVMMLLLIFASNVWMVYIGRGLGSFTDMWIILVLPTYVAEVAGKNTRGASGTMVQVMSTVGMLIMFGIGPFVQFLTMNLIMTAIVVVVTIPIFFIPESPYYLFLKGRTSEAIEILTYLHGSQELALEEVKQYSIKTTGQSDKESEAIGDNTTDINKWSILKDRTVLKTLAIIIYLTIVNQLTGYNAVLVYLQSIFVLAKTSISSELSSLIIGCLQLLACLVTFVITDRFGRKPILCISVFVMGIGMIGLSAYFQILEQKSEIVGFLNYLPVISVAIIIYGYNAGLGSLYWILLAELLPGPIRSYGLSSQGFLTMVCNFLITTFFPSVMGYSASLAFWVFTAFCLSTSLFIALFIPETKGQTLVEIQLALKRGWRHKKSKNDISSID